MVERGDGAAGGSELRKLDGLLRAMGREIARSPSSVELTPAPVASGGLYRAVTRHGPRMAAALVALAGVTEVALGPATPGLTLGFYALAWATATSGLWVMFDMAEKTLSDAGRETVVAWVRQKDLGSGIASVPRQFASLFDRVFGERHLSWRCFWRSCVASCCSVAIVGAMVLGLAWGGDTAGLAAYAEAIDPQSPLRGLATMLGATVLVGAGFAAINFVPDYVSLLETRWILGHMRRARWVGTLLLGDLLMTAIISGGFMFLVWLAFSMAAGPPPVDAALPGAQSFSAFVMGTVVGDSLAGGLLFIPFYSAFFTSAWLWLYAASVPVSRLLLRMNDGVGFLLRVPDVEQHPFRSLGFVSVIVVTGLFVLGLPLLLL